MRRASLPGAGAAPHLYPAPAAPRLRRRAAAVYGFDLSQVIAGNGSDDLLAMIARAFIGGRGVLCCPTPTYTLYDTLGRIQGGRVSGGPSPGD